jgi:serine protease
MVLACGSNGGEAPPPATFSLKGTIIPPVYSAVDSDVNDPNAPYDKTNSPNDSPDQAQEILNPVILAGYVNLPGQGPPGRSFANGDPQDFYQAYLTAGDSIVLAIGRADAADLDLYLYRAEDVALVDASLGTGASESLRAPEDGSYLIAVQFHDSNQTVDGASTYNLIIGGDAGLIDSTSPRLSDDFVAGEVVIHHADPAALSNRALLGADPTPLFNMTPAAGNIDREMRLVFGAGQQARSVFASLNLRPAAQGKSVGAAMPSSLQHKLDTLRIIKALRKRADIRSAEPNWIRHASATPNDDYFDLQWHYDLIHLPEAWDNSTGSGDVVVAVIDTGILVDHPDISERLTSDGYDFISDAAIEGNELPQERGGIDPNPDDPGDQAPGGSTFHGTHVAGTIAAHTNNALGVAGVGWDAARIMPLRAIGVGGGTSYDIIQAVRYAAGMPNDSGTVPDRPADIINISLGGSEYSDVEEAIFQEVIAGGVIVVAAAGNAANSEPSYPAAYDGVISVSAVDYVSSPTYYTNFGPSIDVAAPGGDSSVDLNADGYPDGIWSTMGNDASGQIEMVYRPIQGTSMAAPHVAGVAALMKSTWPAMDANIFYTLLVGGSITDDLGRPGWDDYYGHGLINAHKAILTARDEATPTLLHVSPSAIGFGTARTEATVELEKIGDDEWLSVLSTSSDAGWLTVLPEQIDESGIGTYTVTVDRTGLANGTYNGTLTFVSSENTVTLPVSMMVGQADRTADAGYHYVLLLDPLTKQNQMQVGAILNDGVYHFSFANIPAGDYLLYTGSDINNNLVIGEAGESFGAYLSIVQPVVLRVDNDIEGLEFKTVFNLSLPHTNQRYQTSQRRPLQGTLLNRVND